MKKFNIRKVLDGLSSVSSSSSSQPGNRDNDIQETLQSEHFQLCKGALVSALADDSIHLWNLRQKRPAILHSLKFNRERITFCHLPFQSKWFYVGTERGNIHIVNVESFTLSGYVIMWNKAIELSSKAHPGPVVHISDNPIDEGKLLIGFESGTVVLWDLKSKKADYRYTYDEAIHSVAWHHEGKQFICSHSDGSLTIWNVRSPAKSAQIITPHGKQPKDGKKPEPCKPILKVEYKTTRAGDPFMVLSGGLSYDTVGRRPCLTVMHGKSTAVLEMDYPIVDFLTLCETPYPNDVQEPYAVVVLLEKDLVVIDLAQNGYPIFENPYPLSIHESPVTCCEYFADCPVDLIPALYSVGSRQKRQGYSKKVLLHICTTLHADGSVKFWDASAMMLQVLYKLKTAKVFDKSRNKDDKPNTDIVDEDPFAIQILSWCPESRMLCVAGVSAHVIIYKFSKQEGATEVVQLLEVRLQYELNDVESPEGDQVPSLPTPGATSSSQPPAPQSQPSTSSSSSDGIRDNVPCLKVRSTPLKQSAGYQVELVIQLVWVSGEPPQQITSLGVNSSCGLVVFGNSNGLAIVDYLQKTVLLNRGIIELYGSNDPYQRQPRSPRKTRQPSGAKMSRKLSLPTELKPDLDIRDNSFSRSRSSSVTSIDKESQEAITSFQFCETFTRKTDSAAAPSLLPSLRPLLDVNYLPLTDMRIARTFCFTNNGQALYLVSPTEMQRITYSQDMCENLQEMLGELFTPVETPEAPNRGFFKGLFGGGAQSLDREELFGESVAGKASRSLAQHIPGPGGIEGMKGAASGVVGDLARARIALDERGQKLGELDERTAAMMASAESFSKHAHDMMLKCKDKKWYQF
ncbi:Syntaxin-binding protein 5 [Acipenser ruthenus]|uniref:Syntaxin-binding protein 5-like n=1 Tax=Acipenser ruthenus TaxID=7906 RepID=A0A444U5U9_ACIRT|nr:Syntaxin-binding protein 5 [Acipenser ruthenus]